MSLEYDANNEYLSTTNNLPDLSAGMSGTMWVRVDGPGNGNNTIFLLRDGGVGGIGIGHTTTADQWYFGGFAGSANLDGLTDGSWIGIGWSHSSGAGNFDIYGVILGSTSWDDTGSTAGSTATETVLELGEATLGSGTGFGDGLTGQLANLKLWDAILTEDELWQELHCWRPHRCADINRWNPFLDGDNDLTDWTGNSSAYSETGTLAKSGENPEVPWGAMLINLGVPAAAVDTIIDVPTASFSFTAQTPTVLTDTVINAPTASFSTTAQTPTVLTDTIIQVPTASISFSAQTPTITTDKVVNVPTASITFTGETPLLLLDNLINVPNAAIVFTAETPVILQDQIIDAPTATISFTAETPTVTVLSGIVIDVPTATVTFSAEVPTVLLDNIINAPTASITFVAQVPTVTVGDQVALGAHPVHVVFQVATVIQE